MSVAVIINQKRKRNVSDRLFEYDDGSPMMGMRSKTTQWSGGSVGNINAQSIYYVVRWIVSHRQDVIVTSREGGNNVYIPI